MISKDIMTIVDTLSNEKNLPRDVVVEIVEDALATATRRQLGHRDIVVKVKLDPESGEYVAIKYYVEDQNLFDEYGVFKKIPLEMLACEEVPNMDFNRIAAQTAKQTIQQRIKDAEKKQQVENMSKRLGHMINGTVKKTYPDVLHISSSEDVVFILPRENLLPGEFFRVGDRIRAVLNNINSTSRGNHFILSRIANSMIEQLMRMEIPEVSQEIIQIKAIASDPGVRAKVAVKTNDRRIDPVGACIGMHGIRIQAVSNALGGQRVDIVEWSDDIAQFVINLMSPIKIDSLYVNEEEGNIDVVVGESVLPQAIGKNGTNVQLISQISNWRINVLTEEESKTKKEEESKEAIDRFIEQLGVDEKTAKLLVEGKIPSAEELAFLPIEQLQKTGLSEQEANDIRDTANDFLLMRQLSQQLHQNQAEDDADESLKSIPGINSDILTKLVEENIRSGEDLAELSRDELMDIVHDISEEQANSLIMEARRPWFE